MDLGTIPTQRAVGLGKKGSTAFFAVGFLLRKLHA